jgi:hypothetical protein
VNQRGSDHLWEDGAADDALVPISAQLPWLDLVGLPDRDAEPAMDLLSRDGPSPRLTASRRGSPAWSAVATGEWSYQGITMPTITVKLDRKRAARLARWARRSKIPKSDVIRALIDRAGPIETGEDLSEWVDAAAGKGLGLAQKKL